MRVIPHVDDDEGVSKLTITLTQTYLGGGEEKETVEILGDEDCVECISSPTRQF